PFNLNQKVLDLDGTNYIELVNGVVTLQGSGWTNEKIYINGRLEPSASSLEPFSWYHLEIVNSTDISATSTNFGKVGSNYFAGLMDEIITYDYARTP
ncbi:MAG: hypothetical protein QME61_02910, partial [Patescibacteria group bacterium]|nr:hypothetical protein [Patescibacteria group bacterium]